MFPVVYEIPYHYANPVTGRAQVPALPSLAAQMADYPVAPAFAVPAPRAQTTNGMPASIAAALREIGPRIDGAKTTPLYAPLQAREPYAGVTVQRDAVYGPHERHRVNVFTGNDDKRGKPVLVFIHGGGFRGGAKSAPDSPFYDNIGVWAAGQGLVGITINYRLAPQYQYPAGIEDLTRLVDWLKAHAADYGGDPQQIILWGHSAGGAHVGDYLAHTAKPGVAGAVLMSGIYTLGSTVSVWKDYYGEDVSQYAARESLQLLARSPVPLLITHAELDPESFISDAVALVRARAATGLPYQQFRAPGHSHISESYSVGSGDQTVTTPIIEFVRSLKAVR
jgi:triacylglycerol lipase